jgi:hypothetical protein
MFLLKNRRERESIIVQSMIKMYCRAIHESKGSLCVECESLSKYAEKRLLSCMFGEIKPVCKQCPVHCYSPVMREQMRKVMRWAGPRMIFRNPVFALIHIIDNLTAPKQKKKNASKSTRKR